MQKDRRKLPRVKSKSDNDFVWYCPICDRKSKHLGGHWVQCPTHLRQDDGHFRKLQTVTTTHCVWCKTRVNPDSVKDGMIMCKTCKDFVPVGTHTVTLEDQGIPLD